jgi:hypothetical protein
MENRFDELAKSLAGSVSRREALVRLGAGLAGVVLASLGARPVEAQGNSACDNFCDSIFTGSDAGHCTSDAAHGEGICYQCGPAAPAGHPDFCNVAGIGPTCCTSTAPNCCSGKCVTLSSDVNNCGMCGMGCSGPTNGNGHAVCNQGTCDIVCDNGFNKSGSMCVAACLSFGSTCGSGSPCCSGLACGGSAVVGTCCLADQSTACTTNAQCCSGECFAAGTPFATCCLSGGATCVSDQQCCSGLHCTNGQCQT